MDEIEDGLIIRRGGGGGYSSPHLTSDHLNSETEPTFQMVIFSIWSVAIEIAMSSASKKVVAYSAHDLSSLPQDDGWIAQVVMRWISCVYIYIIRPHSYEWGIEWTV